MMPNRLECRRGRRSAFTLLELLLTLGLAMLLMSVVSYTTLRINAAVTRAEKNLARKAKIIEVAEQLRWQLRCLYLPDYSVNQTAPSTNTRPGTLKYAVYAKRESQTERDILLFVTTFLPKSSGTAEVGYRILTDEETRKPYLAYRQYAWADPLGLHEPEEDVNAAWTVLSRDICGMSLEFSVDCETWQKEWTATEPPDWIRITLYLVEGEPFVTQVSPAMPSARW